MERNSTFMNAQDQNYKYVNSPQTNRLTTNPIISVIYFVGLDSIIDVERQKTQNSQPDI